MWRPKTAFRQKTKVEGVHEVLVTTYLNILKHCFLKKEKGFYEHSAYFI